MEEQNMMYETEEVNNYEVVNDNDFEIDTDDGKDDIMKYIGVAAAAIGAFALVQKGVKAIGKKIKSKKNEDETPKKKVKEEDIIDVEEDELDVVEDDCEDIIEEDETPKKKKKK